MTRAHPYGPLRPDLTPLDLYAAGYVIRRRCDGVHWCHWRKNPYDPNGVGEIFGGYYVQLDDVYADARRLMKAREKGQLLLA